MELVKVTDEGSVRTITLNRPDRRNAVGNEMVDAILEAAADTARWNGQVVVLEGAGKSFCAGADLKAAATPGDDWQARRIVRWQATRMVEAIEALPQVTVASLHGHAIGAGLLLAIACDLRVADPELVIRIPELTVGLPFAMGGIARLIREVGIARARDAILTGRPLAIDEAVEWGIVHRVGDRHQETARLVSELLESPPALQSMTKQGMHAIGRTVVSVEATWSDGDLVNLAALEPEARERDAGRPQADRTS
jgi:enoyl-CoA hydratase/carnithine racemase